MALKKDQSSYNVSTQLKTALLAKNIDQSIQVDWAVYEGSATTKHLAISRQDDGSYRCLCIENNIPNFDFVDENDPLLTRMYTRKELNAVIGGWAGISFSSGSFNGSTYTWNIIHNDVSQIGTDNNKMIDAAMKSFKKVVDAS